MLVAMIGLLIALAVFCLFMLVRNNVVYEARRRAIDHVYDSPVACWDERQALIRIYRDGPSYDSMLWMFRKWTFRDFYPELSDD